MAGYKENFDLDETDIIIIEDAIRNEIRLLTEKGKELIDPETDAKFEETIKRLNLLLGKLYNQKIWYSQVNQTGVPLG